jgi:frataxin-like iron-binding protein CyaY
MKDHEYHALTDAFFQYVEDTIDEGIRISTANAQAGC